MILVVSISHRTVVLNRGERLPRGALIDFKGGASPYTPCNM